MDRKDELDVTVDTLIDLDEPEALLRTLREAARRKAQIASKNRIGRWMALHRVLADAEIQLDLILNAKPAGPDFRPETDKPPGAA